MKNVLLVLVIGLFLVSCSSSNKGENDKKEKSSDGKSQGNPVYFVEI